MVCSSISGQGLVKLQLMGQIHPDVYFYSKFSYCKMPHCLFVYILSMAALGEQQLKVAKVYI